MLLAHPVLAPNPLPAISVTYDLAFPACSAGTVQLGLGAKIRVNTIAPGWITNDTNLRAEDEAQHPVGRVGRPQDIAEAVLYLASAGFVTGQTLVVDGGMTKKMIYVE
jgi:NAD(P)-dependent dehydrogenase (short-subunit alcohol dehydrogenase family)